MAPAEAVLSAPVNAWLTAFKAFEPERLGFVGFSQRAHRDRFLRETRPGVLVAVWAPTGAAPDERSRLVGLLQCSHENGAGRDFTDPARQSPAGEAEWAFAIRAVRAWRIVPGQRPRIADFAPATYSPARATFLGSQGDRLAAGEARKLLDLVVEEVPVSGAEAPAAPWQGPLRAAPTPSRPGPVSQVGHLAEPAEGPKHLYVLELVGCAAVFLNDAGAHGSTVVKPGFSADPMRRCEQLNAGFPPEAAFRWTVRASTAALGLAPLASSVEALVGERAMQAAAQAGRGRSLGGEFFLCARGRAGEILRSGVAAAGAARPADIVS